METFRKVPTCLLYDERGQVLAWGLEAKNANPVPGSIKCEWYDIVTATMSGPALHPQQVQIIPRATCSSGSEHSRPTITPFTCKEASADDRLG
jgi:hypothetical protein